MRSETKYQAHLIKRLAKLFPLAFIIRLPPKECQGLPDVLILNEDKWGMLEIKKSSDARVQPNQSHYVDKFNNMSFAAFIFPENEEQVLNELQSSLGASRKTRVS